MEHPSSLPKLSQEPAMPGAAMGARFTGAWPSHVPPDAPGAPPVNPQGQGSPLVS